MGRPAIARELVGTGRSCLGSSLTPAMPLAPLRQHKPMKCWLWSRSVLDTENVLVIKKLGQTLPCGIHMPEKREPTTKAGGFYCGIQLCQARKRMGVQTGVGGLC